VEVQVKQYMPEVTPEEIYGISVNEPNVKYF
jgi:hypothetical protein